MIERVLPPRKPQTLDRIKLHYDGVVYQSPPHPSAWSFTAYLNGDKVFELSGPIPDLPEFSGNDVIAKFLGLHEALRWLNLQDRFDDHIVIQGDNLMITQTMSGHRPAPDHKQYRPLWTDCRKLAAPFSNLQFIWITKTENREARLLSLAEIAKQANPV